MRWIRRGAPTSPSSSESGTLTPPEKQTLGHSHGLAQADSLEDYSSKQSHFDVYLLEAGIIFHSVIIGVSLGATGGSEWVPLFCAIVFHQFFEMSHCLCRCCAGLTYLFLHGLALGSRIGLLVFETGSKLRKLIMALAFSLITPIGISIGVGVHQSFNVNERATVLSIGVLDSVSAGILVYVGLVQLLAHDVRLLLLSLICLMLMPRFHQWLHGELAMAKGSQVTLALVSLFLGLFGMTLIGNWA